jgi:Phosphotransferase enzyme family
MTENRLRSDVRTRALERAIVDRMVEGRSEWFPELPGSSVRLRPISTRPRAILYAVHLDATETPQALAKVRLGEVGAEPSASPVGGRPRLRTDVATAAELTRFEYTGLQAIAAMFGDDDPRFAAVRPLAHLPEFSAILMDYDPTPALHRGLLAESRLYRVRHPVRNRPLNPASWYNAGAWLRRFHDESPTAGLAQRQETRKAVRERFDAYAGYFGDGRAMTDARDLARRAAALTSTLVPTQLPMAVGHGDFAPRNLFADRTGRVTVIDPMPRWVVPRLEDLGRFLIALRMLGLQLHSHGAAYSSDWLAQREQEFVTGYYGDDLVPTSLLRCYEVLILLDKWSALVERGGRGPRARIEATGIRLAGGFITRQGHRLLDQAEA